MFKKLTAAAAPVSVSPHGLRHPLVDPENGGNETNESRLNVCLYVHMGGAVRRNVPEARKFEIVLQGGLLEEVNVLTVSIAFQLPCIFLKLLRQTLSILIHRLRHQ